MKQKNALFIAGPQDHFFCFIPLSLDAKSEFEFIEIGLMACLILILRTLIYPLDCTIKRMKNLGLGERLSTCSNTCISHTFD